MANTTKYPFAKMQAGDEVTITEGNLAAIAAVARNVARYHGFKVTSTITGGVLKVRALAPGEEPTKRGRPVVRAEIDAMRVGEHLRLDGHAVVDRNIEAIRKRNRITPDAFRCKIQKAGDGTYVAAIFSRYA